MLAAPRFHHFPNARTPPRVPVVLDRAHPLARGIRIASLMSRGQNGHSLVGFERATTGNMRANMSEAGPGLTANTTGFLTFARNALGPTNGADPRLTVFAYGVAAPNGTEQGILSQTFSGSGVVSQWLNFIINSSNQLRLEVHSGSFTNTVSGTVSSGVHAMGGRLDGTNRTVWLDGAIAGTGAYSSTPTALTGTSFGALNHLTGATSPWRGVMSCLYYWSRALSDEEMEWLAAEPYAFLKPAGVPRTGFVGGFAFPAAAAAASPWRRPILMVS